MSSKNHQGQRLDSSLHALAVACHEIRGSLAAIIAHADVLRDGGIPADRCEQVAGVVSRNGRSLLRLFDDIMLASRLESGTFGVRNTPCSIRSLISRVHELHASLANSRGLYFELDVESEVPDMVMIDENAVERILTNLIVNALKFTETGGVRVRLLCSGEHTLLVHVEDTGIGLDPDETDRLFDRFVQGRGSGDTVSGIGLGLGLSRSLARAMSGDLTAVSQGIDLGSTFTLTIPIQEVERGDCSPFFDGLHVLVAEDCSDARALLAHHFGIMGVQASYACDGEQLVTMHASSNESGRGFDALLVDLEMPVLDGWKAIDVIRRQGYRGPIIAFSAHGAGPESDRAMEAGCDACLVKPLDRSSLASTLFRLVNHDQRRIAC